MRAAVATAALALLMAGEAALAARIALPAPTELAERSEAILGQVAAASGGAGRDAESAAARLDAVATDVAARFGEKSIESVQAATEAGIALIRDWDRYDLAHPRIARALHLSRAVFGTDHRETAFALQDLAVVRQELRPELFVQWSGPLVREAIDVRTRVLGAGHLETAGSERFLAAWLFQSWQSQRRASAGNPMLDEARRLADHAVLVMEESYGVTNPEVLELRYLQARIALAQEDYARVDSLANDLIHKYGSPCSVHEGQPGAWELLAAALRGQSRTAEADGIAGALGEDPCAGPDDAE